MSLDLKTWVKGIQKDDDVQISRILATSTKREKDILLHDSLMTSDVGCTGIPTHKVKLARPFTLAAVYGSLKVCDVMIRNDVDVYLLESNSYNVIHCLICVAFYQPHNEEAIVNTYRSMCRMLSKDVTRKLLHMEESNGLRPLEFAAHLGTLRVMLAIFETPKIYVTREDVIGASVYKWYDITEYVLVGAPGCRFSVCPTRFLSMIDTRNLDKPDVRKLLLEGVLADWMHRSIRTQNFLLIMYSVFRILYLSVLFLYEMDSKWLNDIGRMAEGELQHNMKNSTFLQKTYCISAQGISLNAEIRISFEIFLVFCALLDAIYEIRFIIVDFNFLSTTTFPYADLNGRKSLIMNSLDVVARSLLNIGISLLIIGEIVILRTTTEQGYATTILSMMRILLFIFIQASMIFFLQTFPGIGYVLISLRKMNWTFLLYFAVMAIFMSAFSHLQILLFNANSNQECVAEFSSYFNSVISLLSTSLNTFDYRSYNIDNVHVLYISHVCYVCIVGILMYNLLIAIFSDTVAKIHERRQLEETLCQLISQKYIERRSAQIPLYRTLCQRMTLFQLERIYAGKQGRYYLVCPKNGCRPLSG